MKLTVSISGRAEADLTNQYNWYLENAGVDIAERFLNAFDATVEKLGRSPMLGRIRRFRAAELTGVRSIAVAGAFGSHLVFFRATKTVLSLERVMHGARDLERRLVEPPDNYPSEA